ncbi:hypothetical protein FISHEDRAFT_63575 [Fistulina hepatica ATCC 64428]|uniref:Uncharacterized protein n=1 Tax=Fistulina hepatica ATCC 64428 TaxID=1128425 RepID=A0A0D7AM18_9AGAR|nr:hypothetical protein FISHEDRAFT_63575 [Fistulina hepatica ATCC 64428]
MYILIADQELLPFHRVVRNSILSALDKYLLVTTATICYLASAPSFTPFSFVTHFWKDGHDETVEVNQRALIDKVLSRYSGEFTVFRELLQNSDDALSSSVEIHFESEVVLNSKASEVSTATVPSIPPNVKKSHVGNHNAQRYILPSYCLHQVHQWKFKNNGNSFTKDDWDRLKKIAEGNPDEDKIGAFGVGFYSLFSVTENPFVTSGGQWMGFHWDKDQLLVRRGYLKDNQDEWTSFEMPLREPAPIPTAFDFARFLTSSITFMRNLCEVSVYLDRWCLVKLQKTPGPSKQLSVPQFMERWGPSKIMKIAGMREMPMDIRADILQLVYSSGTEKPPPPPVARKQTKPASSRGFFSSLLSAITNSDTSAKETSPSSLPPSPPKPIDPLTVHTTGVSLSIYSVDIDTKLSAKLKNELHRSTKKNPPAKLQYDLIYTAKAEYDASRKEDEKLPFATGSIFQGLRADIEGLGSARVFIGHATAQTTGLGGHMASRFIPTVERESIDLMDPNISIWNKELLYVGGFLARAAYELEMSNIEELWKRGADDETKSWLCQRSLHALKFFTFHESTPSSTVSSLMERSFFDCGPTSEFKLISTCGVRKATDVRIPDSSFKFLPNLPVLPTDVANEAKSMVDTLRSRSMITEITFDDVLKELENPLMEDDAVACMQWWSTIPNETKGYPSIRQRLLNNTILIVHPGTPNEKPVPLSNIRTILTQRFIPRDGPLPDDLLPLSISDRLRSNVLSTFPWHELSILEWMRYICGPNAPSFDVEHNIDASSHWAEQVMKVLAHTWQTMPGSAKRDIVTWMGERACVPTTAGHRRPSEAYFASANLFHDLPVLTLPSGAPIRGNLERVLVDLGVRKHVELQVVFDRMVKTQQWTTPDLIKYLMPLNLSSEEHQRLRNTNAFFAADASAIDGQKRPRYQAKDLYEPQEVFKTLGLRVIDWGARWSSSSREAQFLFGLGLRRYPPLDVLMPLCAGDMKDDKIRPTAYKYLVEKMTVHYNDYNPSRFDSLAFIPAMKDARSCLATPKEVFFNNEWASFGFKVTHPIVTEDAANKLHVKKRPPTPLLLSFVSRNPPKDDIQAREWFGILATRLAEISVNESELSQWSRMAMVPVVTPSEKKPGLRYLPPSQCFLGSKTSATLHSKLFVFVDFGPLANNFLMTCGAKREPSAEEIVQILLDDPHRFHDLSGGHTEFLNELRIIAARSDQLSSTTITRMKRSPILLGARRNSPKPGNGDEIGDEGDASYDLKCAGDIVIGDDMNAMQLFGHKLFVAPPDDTLERFYHKLGSKRLSSVVQQKYSHSSELHNSKKADRIRSLVLERLPLFLHDRSQDTNGKMKVSMNWLTTTGSFKVRPFGKLTVTKTINYGGIRESMTIEASALAQRERDGPIELFIAENGEVDMYEVATSLNRHFFDSPKTNDAFLFMNILMTDLRSLKRRGYNGKQFVVGQNLTAAERRTRSRESQKGGGRSTPVYTKPMHKSSASSISLPAPPPNPAFAKKGAILPSEDDPDIRLENTTVDPLLSRDKGAMMKQGNTNHVKPFSGLVDQIRRKIAPAPAPEPSNWSDALSPRPPSIPPKPEHNQRDSLNLPSIPGGLPMPGVFQPSSQMGRSRSPGGAVTPHENITSNINMAIQACRRESSQLLRNREYMQQVKETLDDGYCDISGTVGNLVRIDVPNKETFLTIKADVIRRFISVIVPLGNVYNLPLVSLHIFCDMTGGIIAFNRNGSIFLNLRYYEAWHDQEVQRGDLRSAYTSLYFTLAHEIAHNLVLSHNAEHEFYFSAICEQHLMNFGRIVFSH